MWRAVVCLTIAVAFMSSACATDNQAAQPGGPVATTSSSSTTTSSVVDGRKISLEGRTVVLDPGHNGGNASHPELISQPVFIGTGMKECDTSGTETAFGYTESEYTLDVALRVKSLLEASHATVVMTRNDNSGVGPCINQRAAVANDLRADVAISIHADGHESGRGFHVIEPGLVPGVNDAIVEPSARLGEILRFSFGAATSVPFADYIGSEGLDVRTDLGGLNLSTVPKVFIETGNMRSPMEGLLLASDEFRQKAAEGIAAAIAAFLGVTVAGP